VSQGVRQPLVLCLLGITSRFERVYRRAITGRWSCHLLYSVCQYRDFVDKLSEASFSSES